MQKTKTRFFVERHNVTVVRPGQNFSETLCRTDSENMTINVPTTYRRLSGRFSALVTIPLGIWMWLVGSVLVDLVWLRIFPLPADLLLHGSTIEIIASRPTQAVALNVCGQLIMLGFAAFAVTRFSRPGWRASLIMTSVSMTLVITNILLTRNFRWPVIGGLVLAPLVSYVAITLGNNSYGVTKEQSLSIHRH